MSKLDTSVERSGQTAQEPVTGISVVVPIFNEIENIDLLYQELTAALEQIGKPYEIVLVDDGSTDGSGAALAEKARLDTRVRVVQFRRNYGQTAAMKAGLDFASHDAIVTIDGDLQNDPADIAPMLAKLEEGYDLVHGWRRHRQDAMLNRKLPSMIANRLISWSTGFPIHDLGCTLKVMRRDLVSEIELYGDMHRFIPILLFERGARCFEMETHHRPRLHGETKYGISRTFVVILDLLTVRFLLGNAGHPMMVFGGLGLFSFVLSFLAALITVAMKIWGDVDMTGNPFLLLSVLSVLAGFQLLSIGLIGEVLARVYFNQRGRKPYTVRHALNFDAHPTHTGPEQ
ncbi:glycosyltransferase family 2 protein [Celeribacter neptunius]|uniref:Glycosyltransferase involved in cell wall bisynthesis n=1 Tax=Celeribacter neptunius TaxID=588602 RepID=A0A1I3NVC4_9RHOB|nr:glycosyltransferase family 2 protein [Celeribacter neptunius]SFJ12970.1 Glycosyltransferase involved in cell wall bisynthesis [Celeribacter neptunius]